AADGDVEDEEEGMVIDPFGSRRDIVRRNRKDRLAVHEPADLVGTPLDGEDVEVVGEGCALRQISALADAVCAGVAGSVNRAVDSRRLAADVLHDVDLARLGPAYRLQVRAEHP